MISLHLQGLFNSEFGESDHINLNKECRPSLLFTYGLQEPCTEDYICTYSCLSDWLKMVYRWRGCKRNDEESAVGAKRGMSHFSNMMGKNEVARRYNQNRISLLVHVIGVSTDLLEALCPLNGFVISGS